jgi:phosphate-selective porin OprO/OprP
MAAPRHGIPSCFRRITVRAGMLLVLALGGCTSALPRTTSSAETPVVVAKSEADPPGEPVSTLVPAVHLADSQPATPPSSSSAAASASGPTDLGQALPTDAEAAAVPDAKPYTREHPISLTDEKNLTINLRGRIQADALMVSQSAKDKAIIGDVPNAVGFNRARLGADGTAFEQVDWVAEFDFASGSAVFKDVFLQVKDLPLVRRVIVGNFKEPFSLEQAMSSNDYPFIQRSPVNALDPSRHWGVGILSYTENERMTLQVGAFRSGSNSTGTDIGDGNDMAYTVRVTGLPWYDKSENELYVLHLGGAFSQTFPKNDTVTFNQGPQSSLLEPASDNSLTPFVKNITIPSNSEQLYDVQAALALNALSFQAEWSAAYVEQIGGGPVFLHGSYVYASFFLTGEHREYLTKDGIFGITHVRRPFLCMKGKGGFVRGPGAWELLARFDYLNFANSNIPLVNGLPPGQKYADGVFGVNWYLNDYARLMFNYVHAVPQNQTFGPSYADAFFIQSAIFW